MSGKGMSGWRSAPTQAEVSIRAQSLALSPELNQALRRQLQWKPTQFSQETLDPLLANQGLQRPVDDLALRLSLGQGRACFMSLSSISKVVLIANPLSDTKVTRSLRQVTFPLGLPHGEPPSRA